MARGSFVAGIAGSSIFAVAGLGGLAVPAFAADLYQRAPVAAAAPTHDLKLSASAAFTTDYVFRGISQTAENPAVQASIDATYNIFYLGLWGSNLDFGGGPFGQDIANLELDLYGGIRPTWGKWNFDLGGIYYMYPGAFDPGGDFNYFEFKAGVSRTFFEKLTLSLTSYYSPENFGQTGNNEVLEFGAAYVFNKWWIFTPTISGTYGHQWGEESEGGVDYNYWNAGLTLGFHEKPAFSLDVRYWDSDLSGCQHSGVFSCDERVVGTVKAVF
jgi:uncharacterized protein (TIGR02001 family)